MSYCDHIIYCYAIYKTKYPIFRYIARDAVCFYVSYDRTSHIEKNMPLGVQHKNCLTESDPKPIQSSTVSNQKHKNKKNLAMKNTIVLLDTNLKGLDQI